MYTAVTLSPLYYMLLVLVPFIFWKSGRLLRRYATWGVVALLGVNAILFPGQYFISFNYLPHALSAWSIALFLFGLAVLSVVSYRPLAKDLTFADPEGNASPP
jgi:hypothetical protein